MGKAIERKRLTGKNFHEVLPDGRYTITVKQVSRETYTLTQMESNTLKTTVWINELDLLHDHNTKW